MSESWLGVVPSSEISLREIEPADLATINRWRNDPELISTLGNNFLYIAPEVDHEWYQSYMRSRDRNVRLAIIVGESRALVGTVNLTGFHPINRSAEFSIMIGSASHRSRGIGSRAAWLMVRHAFQDRNLHRLYLTVIRDNAPAIGLYRKLGFRDEGWDREAVYKNGCFVDLLRMSMLSSEFDTVKPVQ